MKELSLFTGIGGGLLGTKLLGWRTVGMVEIDEYCRKVLRKRQEEGYLDECPIFGDIGQFIDQGYAEAYQGMVDVVTAGTPCQAFSTASHQVITAKSLLNETVRAIDIIRPRIAIFENVLGIQKHIPILRRMLSDIQYESLEPASVGSACLGAPHIRNRLWLLAYSNDKNEFIKPVNDEMAFMQAVENNSQCFEWWDVRPEIYGMDDGNSNRMDRVKAIGNGQVPAVVKTVWQLLAEEL